MIETHAISTIILGVYHSLPLHFNIFPLVFPRGFLCGKKILPGAEQPMPWMSHILRAGEILRGIVESSLSFPIATVSFP